MRWFFRLTILALVLLMPALALADSLVIVRTLDNEITTAEEASFEVTIQNNDGVARTYTLYGLEVAWSVDPEQRRFVVRPGQQRTTLVKVRPLGPFQPSSYSLKLYVDVSSAEGGVPITRYTRELPVILFPEGPVEYLPALLVTVDMDDKIDPQQPLSIKLLLTNRNPLDLTGMTVRIQSEMPEFQKEAIVDVPPLEQKAVEFSITPNPHQQPKDYMLFFVFERYGETVKVVEKKVEILALTPPFVVEAAEEVFLLKHSVELTVRNPGNVQNTQEVKIPVSWWGSLFAGGDADARTEDGQRVLAWELTLSPDEEVLLPYTINYRIPLYIVIALLLFAAFYVAVRSPVRLRKSAITVRGGEEGTLSEVKMTLEIQNISNRHLKDITITDIVPGIANVEKSLELGTLKPEDIQHTKKGTKVIWKLAELEPKEHRMISYKIKAKLNILGSFSLPRASLQYGHGRRHRKAYSNLFRVDS